MTEPIEPPTYQPPRMPPMMHGSQQRMALKMMRAKMRPLKNKMFRKHKTKIV